MDVEDVIVKEEVELQEEKPELQDISQEDIEDNKDFIITVEDFPYICRVCCQRKSDLRPFEDEQYLLDLFHAIRKTDVHLFVHFPKSICLECVCKLKDIFSFIEISQCDGIQMVQKFDTTNEVETVESGISRKQGEVIRNTCEDYAEGITCHFHQKCRICSSTKGLTPLEGNIHLMLLFRSISNINIKGDINPASGYLICETCIEKLEEISLFINLSLCNDDRLRSALNKFESVKAESGSSQIDIDSFTCSDSNLGGAIAARRTTLEYRFVHEIEGKHESIDIKEEFTDAEVYHSKLNSHTEEHSFQFKNCDKSFKTEERFQQNFLTNFEKNTIKNDCNETSFSITSHTNHTVEKPFKCGCCDKSFTQKVTLRHHLRTHTGEKPFKCDFCVRSFSRKSILDQHLLTHTGEKFFKCNFCVKSFSRKSTLGRHLLTHTDEKSFKCDHCEKRFAMKSGLQKHLRTHTGEKSFNCDLCDKSFADKSYLRYHLFTHTGEKPFKCDSCDKSFSQTSSLRYHLLIHSGEKPFKCDFCDRNFNQKRSLRRHLLTHTAKKPLKCKRRK